MQRVLSLVLSLAIMLTLIAAVPVTASAADTPAKNLSFYSASLTLQDNLAINYKVNSNLFTTYGYTNPYVVFEFDGDQTTVTNYRVVEDKYVFDFVDIAPHMMDDVVKATLYATYNGTLYSASAPNYSVATYCYNKLGQSTAESEAEFRTLLVDILQYGAATQIYKGYKTDSLVNARLTPEQVAMGTSTKPSVGTALDREYATIDNPTVTWRGAGLSLDDAVVMRFLISANNVENLTAKVVSENDTEWTISGSKFVPAGEYYYIYFDGFNAAQMRELVYVTVYDGDTAVSNTLCYSIESYAYAKQNDSDTNLKNLLIAMMRYGDAAYNFITDDAPADKEDPDAGWSDWWTPEY